jgi:cell wall-associated NlpC family hydrolase
MWATEYVGIPYLPRGRSRDGLDCWGLVRLVLSERFGKELPSLANDYSEVVPAETARLVDSTAAMVPSDKVDRPEPGDIAVFRFMGLPCHVGVMVDSLTVLHIERGLNAVLSPLNSPRLRGRLEGYYRVR